MKKTTLFTILSLVASLLPYSSASSYVAQVQPTRTWQQTAEVQTGKNTIQAEQDFNAFYIKALTGNGADYQVQIDKHYAGINEAPVSNPEWEQIYSPNSEDTTEFFSVNPTTELTILAANPGTLEINFINSGAQSTASFSPKLSASSWNFNDFSEAGIDIITRAEWGADETVRYYDEDNPPLPAQTIDEGSDYYTKYADELQLIKTVSTENGKDLIWPYEYPDKIRKIVVHHTASTTLLDDPAAAIRGIYQYHAVSRGWGDIGYNFIIDQQGRIYEGRAGGDTVVGGHAGGANRGSIGISVLGNFEEQSVPDAVKTSLIKLTAFLSSKYDLNPAGSESFRGVVLPTIIGHRDVGSTACPGTNLYSLLPSIREGALKNGVEFADVQEYDYEVTGSIPFYSLDPTAQKTISLTLKNTGEATWSTGTVLTPVSLYNNLYATVTQSELLEPEVAPGEKGTFFVTISAGAKSGSQVVNLALKVNGESTTSATFPVPVKVAYANPSFEVVSVQTPAVNLIAGQTTTASLTVKNTSNFTWTSHGLYEVRAAGINPQGRVSSFYTKPEASDEASDQIIYDTLRMGGLREAEVAPGETAHFDFTFTAPTEYGTFVEKYTLHSPTFGWFPDKNLSFTMIVRAPVAKAQLVKNADKASFLLDAGERDSFNITVKNTGETAWEEGDVRFVSDNPFFPAIRTVYHGTISKGETVQMTVTMQAPYKAGVQYSTLKLTNDIPQGDFLITPQVRVGVQVAAAPIFNAEPVENSVHTLTMRPLSNGEVMLQFKNTGSVAWHNTGGSDGQGITMLGTYNPKNRQSSFATADWYKPTRGAVLQENTVEPGEIGTFIIPLTAPSSTGLYKESFAPVIDWIGWMPTASVELWIQVKQDTSSDRPVETTTPTVSTITDTSIPKEETDDPRIRVKLSFSSNRFEIKGTDELKVKTLDGVLLAKYSAGKTAVIDNGTFEGKTYSGLRFEGFQFEPLEVSNWTHNPSWSTTINDNLYRDTLEVRYYNGAWVLINELPLERYLAGLAEVPEADPLDKHKSIVVAARTYALWYLQKEDKFPGAPFDASDDPAVFQKYLGYNYETRAPRHLEAVSETDGEVVYYNGALVKTPYFNSDDGRTRSAEEVWGWTNAPYLISVKDSYCKAGTMSGHGVGLSGCGATGMASIGKTYTEILKYFYTGITINTAY